MAKLVAYMERPDGRVQEYLDQLFASIGNTSSSLLFYYYYIFLLFLYSPSLRIRTLTSSSIRVLLSSVKWWRVE